MFSRWFVIRRSMPRLAISACTLATRLRYSSKENGKSCGCAILVSFNREFGDSEPEVARQGERHVGHEADEHQDGDLNHEQRPDRRNDRFDAHFADLGGEIK